MAIKKQTVKQPFVNILNQTINVGDVCVVVTTGYCHSVGIAKGRYLGYLGSEDNPRVQLEVDEVEKKLIHKVTGEQYIHGEEEKIIAAKLGIVEAPYPNYYKTDSSGRVDYSKRNPNVVAENEAYQKYLKEMERVIPLVDKDREENYHYVDFPYVRRITLQLNLIFKIDTAIENFVKKRVF